MKFFFFWREKKREKKGKKKKLKKSQKNSIFLKIASQITFNIPTYREDQLPDKLKSIPAIKPGSRNLV